MLTEVLDRWEVLVELQQQMATWQQRWDRAQLAFEQSLQSIDQRDAHRLRRVLEESLPQVASRPTSPATAKPTPPIESPSESISPPRADNDTPRPVQEAHPVQEAVERDVFVSHEPRFHEPENASISAGDSNSEEINSVEPGSVDSMVVDDSEATLDDLLTWATEIVGDGVPENVLYQELRNSKYSGQARQLFEALKELDAFYETDDEVIWIRSLRSMHSKTSLSTIC